MSENRAAVWVYQQLWPALFDGLGGVNVANLEAGLRLLKVPGALRGGILQKLLLLAAALTSQGG